MLDDDLTMLKLAVDGGRYAWLLLIGVPLVPAVIWAAKRAGASVRARRAGFVMLAVAASVPFLVGLTSFAIGNSKPYFGARAASRKATCQENLRELSRCVLLYADDFDDTFPPAERWADRVTLSTKVSEPWFKCPSTDAPFAYALNRAIGKTRFVDVVEPASTVVLFESDADERNNSGDESDIAPRHVGMSNVALADGHVRQYRPNHLRPIHWDPKVATEARAP